MTPGRALAKGRACMIFVRSPPRQCPVTPDMPTYCNVSEQNIANGRECRNNCYETPRTRTKVTLVVCKASARFLDTWANACRGDLFLCSPL